MKHNQSMRHTWPAFGTYKVIVTLRVFQYLTPHQKQAFLEARRLARHLIFVVPRERSFQPKRLEGSKGIHSPNFSTGTADGLQNCSKKPPWVISITGASARPAEGGYPMITPKSSWTETVKTILTYGTFDLFHVGHLRLLQRLRTLGDRLIVGVSTDEFNEIKGKKSVVSFPDRIEIVRALRCVDLAFPEICWEQKIGDITEHGVSAFGMGSDWEGRFDELRNYCEVVYLPRTEGISSTHIRKTLKILDRIAPTSANSSRLSV